MFTNSDFAMVLREDKYAEIFMHIVAKYFKMPQNS